MSQPATSFALSEAELATIARLLRKGKESTRKLTRARVLQGLHQQKTPQQLHDALDVCLATVYNVKNRYQQNGLQAAIGEKTRLGQPRKVTQQVEAHITQIACSQAPDGRTRWTASLINERLVKLDIHIDDESVRLVLKKVDGEYIAKMEQVLTLYERVADPTRPRLCFDERPCQLLDDVVVPLSMKPDKPIKEDNEYVRQGTAVVLLAYDLDSGQRYTQTREQRTKKDYAAFMDEIISNHYARCEQVDLIQDNLNTHKYGSFYEHLPMARARQLTRQVVFHFTPKHGSWLNMAEIEFSALARQCLDRRIGSLDVLKEQVHLWTAERNARSVQVHWSFTVAAASTTLKSWYEKVNPANKTDKTS